MLVNKKTIWTYVGVVVLFLTTLFFATYKLTESPPIWMDEGIITQVAQNIALYRKSVLQIAPNEFISAGFVTTGYPVTFPIAVSRILFGQGVMQSRSVMVLFVVLLVVVAFFWIRSLYGTMVAVASSALLVTFAPIYGHGKNVLGEIPGLFYLLCAMICFGRFTSLSGKHRRWLVGGGLFLGLTIATKPIFILIMPAVCVAFFVHRKQLFPQKKQVLFLSVISVSVPLLFWIITQFHGESVREMLSIYANPHSTDLGVSMLVNSKRLFSEAQPFYFFTTMVFWGISYFRRFRLQKVSFVETWVFSFSVLVLLAYLRTIGYYRYFFLAQFFSLLFLPMAVVDVFFGLRIKCLAPTIIAVLALFQLYQTCFYSWVSTHYTSTRTATLSSFVRALPASPKILFYQIPEAVMFYPSDQYWQYLTVTETIVVGDKNLGALARGDFGIVLVNSDMWQHESVFAHYHLDRMVDRYAVLMHN